ncbi:BTB/POZ domain-containing protein KCTD14 isoform X2 [Trichomycterus rosablanca]|uniref:BTB/POZ domain-containing protein KCTD14 isoform X2 n=1 Tax=Trichomycterus rosablanca TaxID=2290929 RepID=UPI002F35B497
MSLPDFKSPRKQSAEPVQQSSVIQLNVGGWFFTTTISTLRKFPTSRLAEMFTGPLKLVKDKEGRFFIDRDGTHFGAVLDYLRTEEVPTKNLVEVHKEAVYYDLKPLVKLLEDTPHFFGETMGRKQFLSRVRNYHENLEVIIRVARAEAMASRYSTIIMCILKTEEDLAKYNDTMVNVDHKKESIVTFGPWNGPVTVEDLFFCIKKDIEARGYQVSLESYITDKGFWYKSHNFFHSLLFTWW